jgi:hypothetical protein
MLHSSSSGSSSGTSSGGGSCSIGSWSASQLIDSC